MPARLSAWARQVSSGRVGRPQLRDPGRPGACTARRTPRRGTRSARRSAPGSTGTLASRSRRLSNMIAPAVCGVGSSGCVQVGPPLKLGEDDDASLCIAGAGRGRRASAASGEARSASTARQPNRRARAPRPAACPRAAPASRDRPRRRRARARACDCAPSTSIHCCVDDPSSRSACSDDQPPAALHELRAGAGVRAGERRESEQREGRNPAREHNRFLKVTIVAPRRPSMQGPGDIPAFRAGPAARRATPPITSAPPSSEPRASPTRRARARRSRRPAAARSRGRTSRARARGRAARCST